MRKNNIIYISRYASGSSLLKILPDNCKKKIDEQLMVGLFPLLSHLQKEKEFIQVDFKPFNIFNDFIKLFGVLI